jgi:D-alanyl-D-alanine carboxypeptidase (penicillin-binding protein 5/6)
MTHIRRFLYRLGFSICYFFITFAAAEQFSTFKIPSPPSIEARSAALVDQATGTLLFSKNPDLVIPPASLTKLVSLHVVYEALDSGMLSRDEIIDIDKRDCSPYIPYGSSLMYLRPGMKVSVLDLMRGAAVVSGNDAAFALARRISGSNEAFVSLMNSSVRSMGFHKMFFVEPSGLSEMNYVTAREFVQFCRLYIELHPESLAELHSLPYIEFPRIEHATADYTPEGRIIQYNRNTLVRLYEGCDGLKTGFIIESGYNLAATARRGDTRFVLVTLGASSNPALKGGLDLRSSDAENVFDWAFDTFVSLHPDTGPIESPRAWYGSLKRVPLVPSTPLAVTLPKYLSDSLSVRVDIPRSVDAPISKGARIGEVVYTVDGTVLRRVELVAERDVPRGGFFTIIGDAIAKFFATLFGSA